ncbi:hypothetical protein ACQ5SO_20745 [Rhodovulum sp. DZ06]|uniref:hypothetical protein n=1 Tax=Rhodovulum sp. DZ06 TaxID=3425126 RepID=UPI003D349CE0
MKARTLVTALALGAYAFTAAGCSSIGTINGVPVSRSMAMEDDRSFCVRNKALCIIGIAVGVGAIAYGMSELYDNDVSAGNGNQNGGGGNGNQNGGGGNGAGNGAE